MKKTITEFEFINGFQESTRSDNFSLEGLKALYDFLTQIEEDTDMEIEFDVIGLCCEFTEYENLEEIKEEYDIESMEDLEMETLVIKVEGTERIIIQSF